MQWLWMWLPDEALVLVIVVVGCGIMLRLLSLRSAGAVVIGIIGMLVAGPFVSALFDALPWWVSALILTAALYGTVRGLMGLFFGQRVTDHALGTLLADSIRFVFLWPFRIVAALFRL